MTVELEVAGIPRPQPRPRYDARTRRIYNPDTARAWKEVVAWAALGVRNRRRLEQIVDPCRVEILFRLANTRRADIDNFAKSTLDALTSSGLWRDDSLVREIHLYLTNAKRPGDAGATIRVSWPIEDRESL